MNVADPSPTRHFISRKTGDPADVQRPTRGGTALCGGPPDGVAETDPEDAFRWMIERSGGGNFVVLKTYLEEDDYGHNLPRIGQGKVSSVETITCLDREASYAPEVLRSLKNAEAIFLGGGDQSTYMQFWKDTPIQEALQDAILRGVPIGGTSAGLAVLGEKLYPAYNDASVTSAEAMADPFRPEVSIEQDFLQVPGMQSTLTDTHFAQRDRLGRLATFLARTEGEYRGIGVDESTAVLLTPEGQATVVGDHEVTLLVPPGPAEVCRPGTPLTYTRLQSKTLKAGDTFDFGNWETAPGNWHEVSVENGILRQT